MKKIPYGQHFIDDNDIKAVVDVLQNHPLTNKSLFFFFL